MIYTLYGGFNFKYFIIYRDRTCQEAVKQDFPPLQILVERYPQNHTIFEIKIHYKCHLSIAISGRKFCGLKLKK